MSSYKWDGDTLKIKEPDPMNSKHEITWEIRLEKNGGWWYKVYKNGTLIVHGVEKTKDLARSAAEGLLRDLLTYINTDYVVKRLKQNV